MLREARILERARSALALNPSQALALCEEHEHQFPTGQLQAERELLEVDALGRLGRYGLAREHARSLLLGSAFYAERTRRLVDAMPKEAGSPE
jgi:hypothetical protein